MNKKLTDEQKETYERDVNNYIDYTNENNEDYKKHNLELVRKEDLRKQKTKVIFKSVISSIIILIGILSLAGVLFYSSYYNKFSPNVFCGNETLTCEGDVLNFNNEPCPACSNSCICPEFPDDLDINLNIVNDTG